MSAPQANTNVNYLIPYSQPSTVVIAIPANYEVKRVEGAVSAPFIALLFLTLFSVFGLLVIIAIMNEFN